MPHYCQYYNNDVLFARKGSNEEGNQTKESIGRRKRKTTLNYNSFFERDNWILGFGNVPFAKCEVKDCSTTSIKQHSQQQQNLSEYDAFLFHGGAFSLDEEMVQIIESWRKPHQAFIFFMMESASIYQLMGFNDFYIYTVTYRLDSDIPLVYGKIIPVHHNHHHPWPTNQPFKVGDDD